MRRCGNRRRSDGCEPSDLADALASYDLLVFSIENYTIAISLVLVETGHDCFNSAIS